MIDNIYNKVGLYSALHRSLKALYRNITCSHRHVQTHTYTLKRAYTKTDTTSYAQLHYTNLLITERWWIVNWCVRVGGPATKFKYQTDFIAKGWCSCSCDRWQICCPTHPCILEGNSTLCLWLAESCLRTSRKKTIDPNDWILWTIMLTN